MGRYLRLAAWLLPAGFIATLFYLPLGAIFIRGLNPATLQVLGDAHVLAAIWFTLWQAVVSVIGCLAIGLPLAYAIYRRKIFGGNVLRAHLVIPFVMPSIIVAMALQPLRGLPAWLVILIANLFLNLVLVIRVVGSIWTNLNREIDDAARLDGASEWQIVSRLHLPQLRSAITSAASLVFLYCATSFSIVLILGAGQVQSIESLTYYALTVQLDLTTASALAIVQTVITLLAFYLSRKQVDASSEFEIESANKLSRVGTVLTYVFLIVAFMLPLGSILLKAANLEAFANLATYGARDLLDLTVWQAIGNSLRNAAIASVLALLVATLAAKLARGYFAKLLFVLPLGVSSVMLGFGYLLTFADLRTSWLVVPLVQAVLATPLVFRQVGTALEQVPNELRDAAATAGANRLQTWCHIEAPLIGASLRNAWAFALLISLGEFGAAALLSYGDQATLPLVLYRLISRPGEQNYSMAMAAAVLLIVVVLAITLATSLRLPKLIRRTRTQSSRR